MIGTTINRWTPQQLALLSDMAAVRPRGSGWEAIAAAVGHSEFACQQRLVDIRRDQRKAIDPAAEAAVKRERKQWTTADYNRLLQLKARRKPMLSNAEIGAAFGLSIKAIGNAVHRLRKEGINVGHDLMMPGSEPQPVRSEKDVTWPLRVKVANPPFTHSTSTAKLKVGAELRARIAVVGVTAGLLGDPLPGRSALDRKRAGSVDPPDYGYHNCALPKPVTLP